MLDLMSMSLLARTRFLERLFQAMDAVPDHIEYGNYALLRPAQNSFMRALVDTPLGGDMRWSMNGNLLYVNRKRPDATDKLIGPAALGKHLFWIWLGTQSKESLLCRVAWAWNMARHSEDLSDPSNYPTAGLLDHQCARMVEDIFPLLRKSNTIRFTADTIAE